MLFDVTPLAPGERFVVETPGGVVHVIGTVFAVEVGERGTAVRVFEGRVRVDTPEGGAVDLGESESWGEGGAGLESLGERGREVAAARASERERPVIEARSRVSERRASGPRRAMPSAPSRWPSREPRATCGGGSWPPTRCGRSAARARPPMRTTRPRRDPSASRSCSTGSWPRRSACASSRIPRARCARSGGGDHRARLPAARARSRARGLGSPRARPSRPLRGARPALPHRLPAREPARVARASPRRASVIQRVRRP